MPKQFAESGGPISYSASFTDTYRRAASYVDQILKGAKPGESAVEHPTRFELVFNLRTAKTLGLTSRRHASPERITWSSRSQLFERCTTSTGGRPHKTRGAGAASCPYSQSNPWLRPRLRAAAVVTWLA